MKYRLIDYWDHENQRSWEFDHHLKKGEEFEHDDVGYCVVKKNTKQGWALVRMVRYRIPDTSTQFVHKCPAKRQHTHGLSRDDVVKLEERHGKTKAAEIMNERVKIRSHGVQTEFPCPYCKTVFWKKNFAMPEEVQVDRVMGKKQLKKRAESRA